MIGKPVWESSEDGSKPDKEQCKLGNHTWVAFFFGSGRLAYWQCPGCGKTDRDIDLLPRRLDRISGWIRHPPLLVAHGLRPLASTRKWVTTEGLVLTEGDPSSIHFVGLSIPEITEAHTYVLREKSGKIREVFEPIREQPWQYTDHFWLTRFQVINDELMRFRAHCFEESTLETPFTQEPKKKILLSELKLLSHETGSGK
jgi:hypothetical protein